jgi:hypothetical protein
MKVVYDEDWEGLMPRLTQGEWTTLDEAETIVIQLHELIMDTLMSNPKSGRCDWAEPLNELSDCLEGLRTAMSFILAVEQKD